MKKDSRKALKQALGLGAIAGLRATFAPSLASHFLNSPSYKPLSDSTLRFINLPASQAITKILSTLEVIADKLPSAPDRTSFPQLITRIVSGGLIGATIYQAYKGKKVQGLLLGAAAAALTTYAGFYARKYLGRYFNVPDAFMGAVEDFLAAGGGIKIMNS